MTYKNYHANNFQGDVLRLSWKLELIRSVLGWIDRLLPVWSTRLMLYLFLQPRRKKDMNYAAHLPPGARRLQIFHNLTRLTGWTWGDTGPAVLLVHGWEGHTGRMAPMVKPLLDQGFRVVAFDAPGHGLSPHTATHLIDYRDAIQDVIEQHGPFYGIVAHSFGAIASTILLADEPRFMPEKLALLSPMRDLDQHLDIFATLAGLSPDRKARLRKLVARRLGVTFLEQCSTIEAVQYLDIPGLVIHDRQDLLIPYEVGKAIAKNWLDARFVLTHQMGHQQGLKNDFVIKTVTDYLMDHPSANSSPKQPPCEHYSTQVYAYPEEQTI